MVGLTEAGKIGKRQDCTLTPSSSMRSRWALHATACLLCCLGTLDITGGNAAFVRIPATLSRPVAFSASLQARLLCITGFQGKYPMGCTQVKCAGLAAKDARKASIWHQLTVGISSKEEGGWEARGRKRKWKRSVSYSPLGKINKYPPFYTKTTPKFSST